MTNATATTPADRLNGEDIAAHVRHLVTDSIAWITTHWWQILVASAIGIGIFLALHALKRVAMRLRDGPRLANGWGAIVGRVAARTGSIFILMTAAKLVANYAEAPPAVATTITFLFTVAAVFQAALWVRELILALVEHRTQTTDHAALGSAMGIIRILVSFAVFAIALIVVLDNLNVNVTGLVAGLGVGGIAIGLAAQGIFGDLFAALAIIFDRPFRVGDKVQYDQTLGVIEAIGLKSTRVRSFTGEVRIIANKNLLEKEIQNTTRRDHVRTQLTIGVAYETPPDTLAALPAMLTGIVEQAGGSVPRASFEAFGASAIDFVLQIDTPGDDWPRAHVVRDAVMVGILRRFATDGIVMPYPTQTTYTAAPDGRLVMPYPVPPAARQEIRTSGSLT